MVLYFELRAIQRCVRSWKSSQFSPRKFFCNGNSIELNRLQVVIYNKFRKTVPHEHLEMKRFSHNTINIILHPFIFQAQNIPLQCKVPQDSRGIRAIFIEALWKGAIVCVRPNTRRQGPTMHGIKCLSSRSISHRLYRLEDFEPLDDLMLSSVRVNISSPTVSLTLL